MTFADMYNLSNGKRWVIPSLVERWHIVRIVAVYEGQHGA